MVNHRTKCGMFLSEHVKWICSLNMIYSYLLYTVLNAMKMQAIKFNLSYPVVS